MPRGPLPAFDAWLGDVCATGAMGAAGAGWLIVVPTLSALIVAGWVVFSGALFVTGVPPAAPVVAIAGVTVVGTELELLMGDGDCAVRCPPPCPTFGGSVRLRSGGTAAVSMAW